VLALRVRQICLQLAISLLVFSIAGAAAASDEQKLAELKARIEDLNGNLAAAKIEVKNLGKRPHVYGEMAGSVDFSSNSSVKHQLFNAVRLAYSPDSSSNTVMMLYLRNGLGGTTAGDIANAGGTDFSLRTRLAWERQSLNLTLGNFYFRATPFTIQNAYRAEDHTSETRKNFNGIRFDGRLLQMPYVGIISPLRSGGGIGFDRYLYYQRVQTRLKNAGLTLSYLRVFDDNSQPSASRAYDSKILSSLVNFDGMLLGNWCSIISELCLSSKDNDLLRGPIAKAGSAFRLSANTSDLRFKSTRVPVHFSSYRITKDYPTDYNTVRQLPDDYLYQEEENPRIPDYLANAGQLQFRFGPVRKIVGSLATSTDFNLVYTRELEPVAEARKTFGFLGVSSTIDLDLQSALELSCGSYLTARPNSLRYRQDIYDCKLRRSFTGLTAAVGYKVANSRHQTPSFDNRQSLVTPYLELNVKTGAGTVELKLARKSIDDLGRHSSGWKHEIQYDGRISSGVRLSLDYTDDVTGNSHKRDIYFSYRFVY
jgi:hypothetical protein